MLCSDAVETVTDQLLETTQEVEEALAQLSLPQSLVDAEDLNELWRCPHCKTWIHIDDRSDRNSCYHCSIPG